MVEGASQFFNAAAQLGPVGLLALAILAFIWQFAPIARKFVEKIGDRIDANNVALQAVEVKLAEANKVNDANAGAVGGLAETISQLTASINGAQTQHGENQVQLSANLGTLAGHFNRSTDVLSQMHDRMGTQSTQMDLVIGDTTATRKMVEETHVVAVEIQKSISSGIEELAKITTSLKEMQAFNTTHHCIQPADLDRLLQAWDTTQQDILNAINQALTQGNPQPETAVPSNN